MPGRDAIRGRLLGKLRRTVRRWEMLGTGEATAVAVSGGHDSLALVVLLALHSRHLPEPVPLVGLHVPLSDGGAAPPLPEETVRFCRGHGVEVEEVAARLDPAEETPLGCFRCARIRRRTLLEAASARGCRALAIGHHADDLVETFMLGLMYTGRLEALAPVRSYFDGAIRVVRPLLEIRRQEIRRLAAHEGFPPPPPACGREEDDARRDRVAAALRALGPDERRVRRQLYWAALRTRPEAAAGGAT